MKNLFIVWENKLYDSVNEGLCKLVVFGAFCQTEVSDVRDSVKKFSSVGGETVDEGAYRRDR